MDASIYRAKMALSLPSKLLSRASWWAVLMLSLSSDFLFSCPLPSSHLSDGNHRQYHPPKNPFHQEQMYSIIYGFSYLCTLCFLSHSLQFIRQCLCVFVSTRTRARAGVHVWTTLQAYASAHVAVPHWQHLSWAENRLPFLPDTVSRCYFMLQMQHPASIYKNPTINHLNCCWQTSKHVRLAAHFLSISNTQVDRNTKEQ